VAALRKANAKLRRNLANANDTITQTQAALDQANASNGSLSGQLTQANTEKAARSSADMCAWMNGTRQLSTTTSWWVKADLRPCRTPLTAAHLRPARHPRPRTLSRAGTPSS
jgi:hypothetical protein